jgi:hypothetical protein
LSRFFYLALPPITYPEVCEYLKRFCIALNGWTRVVVEKPFGRDLRSSEALNEQICCLFECAPSPHRIIAPHSLALHIAPHSLALHITAIACWLTRRQLHFGHHTDIGAPKP